MSLKWLFVRQGDSKHVITRIVQSVCRERPVRAYCNPYGLKAGAPRRASQGLLAIKQSGPTTSDMAERFTGPCRECMEWLGEMGPSADDVYSCFAGCTSRALESGALPLTSASSRGRQSVNARPAVISTDRQTDALSDSIFWLSLNGTLGPKKAREDPIYSAL